MTIIEHSTSRRAVIAGLLAAPAMGGLAAVPATATPPGDLSAKIAKVRKGMKVARDYDLTVCGEVSKRFKAARAAWERACEGIPHYMTKATYEAAGDGSGPFHRAMSTANSGDLAVAASFISRRGDEPGDLMDVCRELHSAEQGREAERQRLREAYGLPAIEAEWRHVCNEHDNLDEAWLAHEQAVISHRCATANELANKIAFAVEQDFQNEELLPALLADAKRLAQREA